MSTSFRLNNFDYHLDTVNQSPGGLYRQNAMTYYHGVTDWCIVAKEFHTNKEIFYLIKCKKTTETFYQWVQVDTTLGRNLVGPFLNTLDDDDDDDDDTFNEKIKINKF